MPEAVNLASRVIAVSLSTAKDLKAEMPDCSDKIIVIPLGAPKLLAVNSKGLLKSLGISEPFILFVGTIEPRKNLSRLLEAYARLSTYLNPLANLVIAGGVGWGDVDLVKMVRRLGLQEHVRILGYVSEEQLTALYRHAKFLAMPSIYEGFGLPLVEAMAHGCPVLTSLSSSMPEVAGNAGFFVDPWDINSIESGLRELMINKELLNGLANNALLSASRFSWDRSAKQTLDLFEAMVL
jgi:glycosyltransferase involved in cell wall biosynthesis